MIGEKDDKRQLLSTDLNGEAQRVHASGELANDFAISPDGRLVAFRQNYQAFVMPLMPGGQEVEVAPRKRRCPSPGSAMAAPTISTGRNNGAQLHWSLGPTLYTVASSSLFPRAPAGRTRRSSSRRRAACRWRWTSPRPSRPRTVALTGARS